MSYAILLLAFQFLDLTTQRNIMPQALSESRQMVACVPYSLNTGDTREAHGCSTGLEVEHLYLGLLFWLPRVKPVIVSVKESRAVR